jgi:hypothetical protein
VIHEGDHINVEGVGSAQDPYVISADFDFGVLDNDTFNLSIDGAGSDDDPYVLTVNFAGTASVKDLPDWSDTVPSNGQVPVWNAGLGRYVPGSPTPAASGSVNHDGSLTGDGSPGAPLGVVHDALRFTETSSEGGIGLTDDGINSLVRRFANATARDAAFPAVDSNTVSALDSSEGFLDIWAGTDWTPVEGVPNVDGGALIELSGPYAGGRVHTIVKQVALTTGPAGTFPILDPADYGSLAGILSVTVQPVGTAMFATLVTASTGGLMGTAYRLDTGGVFTSQPIQAVVTAIVY